MLYHNDLGRRALLGSLSLLAFTAAQSAQARSTPPASETGSEMPDEPLEDDLHDRRLDSEGIIVVTAQGLRNFDLLAGTRVVEAAELQANLEGQIGEVLTKLPGVSASGFAPGASRPILRGFSGGRVKVLVDGLGALDASNTSADHAVSIDPLTAESIEVLRGPAVLLYGSQAIGGAVNVIDKRIPRRVPAEPVHIDAMLRADTAADTREAGASLDVPLGGGFVAHIDGSWRDTEDLDVPGLVLAPGLRQELLAEALEEAKEGHAGEASELRELAQLSGQIRNTATETFTVNGGVAFLRDESSLGVALGVYDTNYGVPLRPGAGHHHGDESGPGEGEEDAETVSIDLRQLRADLRGDVRFGGGFFERLTLRAGFSDYTHTEFEGVEVGTVFDVQGMEARAELVQNARGAWRGALGAQYLFRDFDAFGAEAYVAPNRTEQLAGFALQEYGDGPFQVEGALRYESTRVNSVPLGLAREFDALSGAIGLTFEPASDVRTGVNLSRVARAPSAEELFSNGPHIATQAFEVGDPGLSLERAWGAEVFARGRRGGVEFNFAGYKSWFDDYIYLAETGGEEDGLPVFTYLQADATYSGIEGELRVPLIVVGGWDLTADLRGEYVTAKLADGTPVPRIPPLSLLGALEASSDRLDGRVEVEWFDDQTSLAPFETPTGGFTLVNAALTWRPITENDTVSVIVKADNILDVTGRRHASFTKDFVPLAGRDFSVSARLSF